MSAERTKEPGSSECTKHRQNVSNIRSAWLPADQHENEFTVVEKADDVIDPFTLFQHRTTAARLDHRDPSFLSPAAVAAAIMVIPSDLPTVLPGPGKQKENPTAQPKASKPTRCGAYELVGGGLPAQAD